METPRPLPRPPAITFVGLFLIFAAIWAFVEGMYEMNLGYYEPKPRDLVFFVVVGPLVAAVCGSFMLRGKNWARFAFILAYGYVLFRYLCKPKLAWEHYIATAVYVFGVIAVFRPNAHWFFTGRDYFRRERAALKQRRMVQVPMAKAGRASDYKY